MTIHASGPSAQQERGAAGKPVHAAVEAREVAGHTGLRVVVVDGRRGVRVLPLGVAVHHHDGDGRVPAPVERDCPPVVGSQVGGQAGP